MPEEAEGQMWTKWSSDHCLSALLIAVIDQFPNVTDPIELNPIIGESLRIGCTPPRNYPKGSTYFGYSAKDSNKLENIVNDNRVLLDYEGWSCAEKSGKEKRAI